MPQTPRTGTGGLLGRDAGAGAPVVMLGVLGLALALGLTGLSYAKRSQ
jgi:hypothetical protein